MKKNTALALTLLAACGGNYSNEDVEFVGALPVRRELESKLPQQTVQSALQGTRQDAISVGQPSQAYLDTRGASDSFNAGLFSLLQLIEDIRQVPPTRREPDRRVWGPFPDKDNNDFLVEAVIERRQLALFDYRIEVRRKDAPASSPWIAFVSGSFYATGGARKGIGEVHLFAKAARDAGLPTPGMEDLNTLDVSYVTDRSPTEVNMLFQAAPSASFQIATYAYREYDDRHGSIQFLAKSGDLVYSETARWLTSGRGRADIAVTSGPFFGAQGVECWDEQFLVTYFNRPWENPPVGGDPASCPF
jgi:hypothetical protein